jgi:formylglycine-generating enzyme required for sulfatase activity
VSLPAGEYTVRCTLSGFVPAERHFQIAPNKELPISIPLEVQHGPATGQIWTIPGLSLAMLPVAAGEFDLGPQLNEAGRDPSEGTAIHTVVTSPYWLGQNEITRNQWSLVMENRAETKEPDLPKTGVNYAEVLAFAERLNARETVANRLPQEHHYTLPTEAQWEYACRAGTKTPFACGDRLDSTQANFNSAFPYGGATPTRAVGAPVPVGGFPANAWGFRDMHGNVWEWCLDPASLNPAAGAAVERIARGGAWNSPAHRCRSAARIAVDETTRSAQLGFRIALIQVPAIEPSSPSEKTPAKANP